MHPAKGILFCLLQSVIPLTLCKSQLIPDSYNQQKTPDTQNLQAKFFAAWQINTQNTGFYSCKTKCMMHLLLYPKMLQLLL